MVTVFEAEAEIDRFEGGSSSIVAEIVPFSEEMEYFTYNHQFVPIRAKYAAAMFELELSVTAEPQGITGDITPETSVTEFKAETGKEYDGEFTVIELYAEDGHREGYGSIRSNKLPEWLAVDGGECYVTVRVEYDEEDVKAYKGWSDEDIQEFRQRTERKFENIFSIDYS